MNWKEPLLTNLKRTDYDFGIVIVQECILFNILSTKWYVSNFSFFLDVLCSYFVYNRQPSTDESIHVYDKITQRTDAIQDAHLNSEFIVLGDMNARHEEWLEIKILMPTVILPLDLLYLTILINSWTKQQMLAMMVIALRSHSHNFPQTTTLKLWVLLWINRPKYYINSGQLYRLTTPNNATKRKSGRLG